MTEPLRSALIGANSRRGDGHAAAYALTSGAQLVAVTARTPGVADDFAVRWGVPLAFTDHLQMLEEVKPDIVHLNTPPSQRRHLLEDCDRAGVRGIVLEKPIGEDSADHEWLVGFAARTNMRIVVNHQLHYHPARIRLLELVRSGAIGKVLLVDGSARMSVAYQGSHVLQGIHDFVGADAVSVFGQASGVSALGRNETGHRAPDASLAEIRYSNGVTAFFRAGIAAPPIADDRAKEIWQHKRIAVVGERGRVEWTMWGWSTLVDGVLESGLHEYREEDILGQAALVDGLVEWILDPAREPAVSLRRSLDENATILGLYLSALEHRVVALPATFDDDLLDLLQEHLTVR